MDKGYCVCIQVSVSMDVMVSVSMGVKVRLSVGASRIRAMSEKILWEEDFLC